MVQDALRVDLDKLTEMAGQLDELATTASAMKTTPDELWLGTPTLCLECAAHRPRHHHHPPRYGLG